MKMSRTSYSIKIISKEILKKLFDYSLQIMENVHIIKWGKVVKINIFRCTAAQCSLSFFLRKKTERTIVKSYKNNIQQLVNHQRWYLKTLEIKRFRLN